MGHPNNGGNTAVPEANSGVKANNNNNAPVSLRKPTDCHLLAEYMHAIGEKERKYLSQKICAWIDTNNLPLKSQFWRDGIGLLNIGDVDVSSTWLTKVHNLWTSDPMQNDWVRTVLIETIIRLQYQQPEVLSAGGVMDIMAKMVAWLNTAEKAMGTIPSGAEEGWRMVMVVTNYLASSGIGQPAYEKLLWAIEKLEINRKSIHDEYNKLLKEHKDLLNEINAGVSNNRLQGNALEQKQEEVKRLETAVQEAYLKDMRFEQLVASLRMNRACLEIRYTRTGKWGAYKDLGANLFGGLVNAAVGVGAIAVGAGALGTAIAAVPATYGGAAVALVPAVAGFSGSIIAGVTSLVQAGFSGVHAGMSAYFLYRQADPEPIRELFLRSQGNFLEVLKQEYLKEKKGAWVLKPATKRKDSWHLILFLEHLLVYNNGAAALAVSSAGTPIVDLALLNTLLRALYKAHSRDQNDDDKAICAHTVALVQVLQQQYHWPLLSGNAQDLSPEASPDAWVKAYQADGWLPAPDIKSKQVEPRFIDRLADYIRQYDRDRRDAIVTPVPEEKYSVVLLPWNTWYQDQAVENLVAIYECWKEEEEKGKGEKKEDWVPALTNAHLNVMGFVPLARNYFKGKGDAPVFSSWAMSVLADVFARMEQHCPTLGAQKADVVMELEDVTAYYIGITDDQGKKLLKAKGVKVVTQIEGEQFAGTLQDEKLTGAEKVQMIQARAEALSKSRPDRSERMHHARLVTEQEKFGKWQEDINKLQEQINNCLDRENMDKELRKELIGSYLEQQKYLRESMVELSRRNSSPQTSPRGGSAQSQFFAEIVEVASSQKTDDYYKISIDTEHDWLKPVIKKAITEIVMDESYEENRHPSIPIETTPGGYVKGICFVFDKKETVEKLVGKINTTAANMRKSASAQNQAPAGENPEVKKREAFML